MSKFKLLIIDDDLPVRNGLENFFEDLEIDVSVAESAEIAMTLVTKTEFDAIIVDLRLPGMSGDDFLLEAYPQTKKTIFLIYTGSTNFYLPLQMQKLHRLSKKVFEKPLADLNLLWEEINRLIDINSGMERGR